MPVTPDTARITFEKGILESQEPTKVPVGFLQECINWVPEPTGGLRCRPKWFLGSTAGVPATRRCKGMGLFQRFTQPKIVQMASVYTRTGSFTDTVPTFSWAVPTQPGNLLVAIVTGTSTNSTGLTFTAEGWTTRLSVSGSQTGSVPWIGVYEFQTSSEVFQGTESPFILDSTSPASLTVQIRVLELTGVSSFDQLVETTAHSGAGSGDFGATVTGAANAQASELMFAVGAAAQTNNATPYTLNTATTGWTKYTDTSLGSGSNFASLSMANVVWTKIVNAAETPDIVITETATGSHTTADLDAVLMTYKGWNDAVDPSVNIDFLLAADDNTATYDIYAIERETMDVATWDLLDGALGDTTSGAPVSFAVGLGAAWYTAPSFDGLRRYNGIASTVAASPSNATSVTFHRDRMWAAAGSRLSWSQIGDGNTWPNSSDNTGAGYFDVNLDDGENIECVAAFSGLLVIGKRTSCHVVTGRNAEEFALEPLPGGDAAPGQSIIATPYGCVIAGRHMVYILGANSSALTLSNNVLTVSPLGRPIEASYSVGTDEFVWCDYADGSVYVTVGTAGKTFVYDFEAQAWHVEQVHHGLVESPAVTFSYDNTQYFGPVAGVIGSLANYRRYPHGTRGKDFETLAMTFSAQTGDLSPAGVRQPITPRQCFIQVRQRDGGDDETGITVTPVFNGELGEDCEIPAANIGVRREVVSGFPQRTGVNTIGVRIASDVPSGESVVYDIEDMFLDFIVESPRA